MSQGDYFEYGEAKVISQMTEQEAVAIFGRPLYEAWRNTFGCSYDAKASLRVKSVDRQRRVITVEFSDD